MYEDMKVLYKAEVTTKSGSLNVRSGAGKTFPVIFKLVKGAVVSVNIEYDNGWRFITDAQGRQGYCDGQFLTPIDEQEPDNPEDPKEKCSIILTCDNKENAEYLLDVLRNAKIVID